MYLQYLQFDLATKVNLSDLSYALEQEIRTVEEDNATYQAAIASLEYELRQQRYVCYDIFAHNMILNCIGKVKSILQNTPKFLNQPAFISPVLD